MATETDLRDRTFLLLASKSAQMIEFTFDGIYFVGTNFSVVTLALKVKPASRGRIGFRTGKVAADADAQYDPDDNVIDVPSFDYGKTAGDRDSLVHECFHAWRDSVGGKVPLPSGGAVATTALTDEAMAFLVGALFTNYDTTPPGKTPMLPPWASDPAYAEAHRIAPSLMGVKNPVVS